MTTTMTSKRHIAEMPFAPSQLRELKDKMLNWASQFSICLFLDSNDYPDKYGKYDFLMAAGARQILAVDEGDAFAQLQRFHDVQRDWLFGHIAYDLKNSLEPLLHSRHGQKFSWKSLQFFVPEVVCYAPRGEDVIRLETFAQDAEGQLEEIIYGGEQLGYVPPQVSFRSRITRDSYLEKIAALREHIRNGDCYEITFCNEAFAEGIDLNPLATFKSLNALSPAPFAAYYQDWPRSMMCASPERFLQSSGRVVRSQPIKGTSRRSADASEDERLKEELCGSEKEQAENVMITDLVRNDLARSCEVGSIQVEELFGIYSFPQVHQMISTVRGVLREGVPFTDAIRHAFPMGSMTGAPKHKVMQLIDKYEAARRELFSGSVGYISPDGDFDFAVVIRSLFYDAETRYLSYQTGGAITWGSDAESEWDELRLKALAIERIFS